MRRREFIAEEALEALRASEVRLHRSLEAAGLGHWDFDFASGELVWSAQIRKLLGSNLARLHRGRCCSPSYTMTTVRGLRSTLHVAPALTAITVAISSSVS
jgi:hypothetical protein